MTAEERNYILWYLVRRRWMSFLWIWQDYYFMKKWFCFFKILSLTLNKMVKPQRRKSRCRCHVSYDVLKKPSEKSFGIKIQRLWHKPIYLSSPCLIHPAQTEFPNGAISVVPLANPLFRSHHPFLPPFHTLSMQSLDIADRRPHGEHGRVAWWEALASWCEC